VVNLEELAKLRWIEELPYGAIARRMRIAASTLHSKSQELKLGWVKYLRLDPADLSLIEARMKGDG